MKHPHWTQADSREAKQIWEEYQKVGAFGLVLRLEILPSKEILKD